MHFNKSEKPEEKEAIGEGEINQGSRKDESNTCEEAQSFSKNIEGRSLKRGAVYQQWLKPTNNVIWRLKEGVVGLVAGSCKSGKNNCLHSSSLKRAILFALIESMLNNVKA